MTYLDTSALIKRFVAERGSLLVSGIIGGGERVATATVAYVEVYAGLTRRYRRQDLSGGEYARACREFETDWPTYAHIELGGDVLRRARTLVERHALRAFDAVHLASAIGLAEGLGEDVTFAAADERLLRAAEGERLAVLNVETAAST